MGVFGIAAVTFAMDPGQYRNSQGDKLNVLSNGEVLLTQTRQVGGSGGLSNAPIVPYPTNCKFVQFGKISDEGTDSLTYQVSGVSLLSPVTEAELEKCISWTLVANTYSRTKTIAYSINKNEFKD